MNNSDSYSNKDDVVSATWPDSLCAMGDYPYYPYGSVPQSTYPDPVSAPGYPDINAANDAAFSLAPATEMGAPANLSTQADFTSQDILDPWSMPTLFPDFNNADHAALSLTPATEMGALVNLPTQADFTSQNVLDSWSMLGPSFFDANSSVSQPQLVGDPHTGVAPLAADSVAATPDSSVSPTSTTPMSQEMWAWVSDFLQSPLTTPTSSPGHEGEAGWVALEHGANPSDITTSPAGWDASGLPWPIRAAPGDGTTFAPAAALGKRCREAEPLGDGGPAGANTHEMPPPKRARGGGTAKGIPKAARSTARTRLKPAARIPNAKISSKPKEAGRGAERLATPSSQGIYHQSLPGPSFRQGWVMEAADGTLTWVEGSVDEEAEHHIDSTVQQQHEEETELLVIPRKFKPEYRSLLEASEADLARGAVQTIKCRICRDTKLKNFEEFKRHCRTTETHPLEIHFCDHCGDFFARPDSLKRHRKLPPAECIEVTQANAAEKRRVTKEEHKDFIRRLMHGLMTGEGIGRPFSQIIKEKYPESSKKRTGGSK